MMKPNLHFDKNWFLGEEQEGFWVEPMMKNAWASELEVLFEIDRICKKYDIQYFADSGTLLGAIRHKGFIPWDDDIDIAMKRPDYQKFLSVLKDELPEGYAVFHPEIDNFMKNPNTRIMNSDTIRVDQEFMIKYHGCPFITGVDIFPLDYVPRDEHKAKVWKQLIDSLFIWGKAEDESIIDEQELRKIEEGLKLKLDRRMDLSQQVMCLLDQVISMYGEEESDELVAYAYYIFGESNEPRYKKEWFDEVIYAPFVNMMLPIPKEYDKILTVVFGDWRTPVRGTSQHNYPFYRHQEIFLENLINQTLQKK